ncbi:guanylate kinase [Pararhizobium sp. IMCC21322]|uniref:guanylate kinase n=1 Tax=Pararhizobium sp. IMCC21322 TaxID=3067903 RepID=UPI0027424646|nr:guanylate kinase [Pararhizobium sp. IMCC21322]
MRNSSASTIDRRGVMLVLSSPSGAGKSSIAREILSKNSEIELSVSVTTRAQRPSEIEGTHYHFIDQKRFSAMRDRNELLEWAEVHGNFYGTPRDPVEEALSAGRDVLFDIDWQGTRQLHERMPEDLVRIFVLPPSIDELKSRLERRAEDSADVIAKRLANSALEMEQWSEYDYVIINEKLELSVARVQSILDAERMRRDRVVGINMFVEGLINQL